MPAASWSAQRRISSYLIVTLTLVGLGMVVGVNWLMRDAATKEAQEKAEILLQHNLSIHAYVNNQQKPHLLSKLETEIAQGYFEPSWMSSTFIVRRIESEYQHRTDQKYYYKEAAINARSPVNEADPFEREYILKFNQDPEAQGTTEIRHFAMEPYLVVIRRGEAMEGPCLRCHSDPDIAPKGLVAYYGAHRSFGRQLGELVSVVSIRIPLAEAYRQANLISAALSALFGASLLVFYLLQARLVRQQLVLPLGALKDQVEGIALSPKRIGEQVRLEAGREFDGLVQGFNLLSANLAKTQERFEQSNQRLFRQMEELDNTQQDLARMNQRFQELVANVPGVVFQFETDPLGRIHLLYVSADSAEALGVDAEEAVLRPERLGDFVEPEDLVALKRAFERAVDEKSPAQGQFRVQLPAQGQRWHQVFIRPAHNTRSALTWDGLVVDISAQKQLEEQLKKAEREALAQSQAKGRFLATMSHEVRAPMNAILGYAELLDLEIPEGPLRNYIQAIETSGHSLMHIINDILDLSQIEAGRMRLHERPTQMGDLARAMESLFALAVNRKGLDFKVQVAAEVEGWYQMDPDRLRQVLVNLVGNAVKFTDQGQVTLSLRAEEGAPDQGLNLLIEVQDTGIGISAEELPKIFEPFSHHEEAGRTFEGTGLGLSITKTLVERMGGVIEVQSRLGEGSVFRVRFKGLKAVDAPAASEAPEVLTAARKRFQPAKVLVVDDMEINRLLVVEYLRGTGLEALQAANGSQAIEVAQKEGPQLVLMDLKMPVMGGVEATRLLKANPLTAHIPVVALTASVPQLEQYQGLGFEAYLTKPIDTHKLFSLFARFLKTS
ncbi:MAG: DUF3365 domain-containing protein [bacterium]|nr:DUF3365 domain-containing protein [bacterium]